MSAIRVPALVVASADDPAIAKSVIEREVLPRLPQPRMTVVAAAGHLLPLETPEEVAAAIRGFVEHLR